MNWPAAYVIGLLGLAITALVGSLYSQGQQTQRAAMEKGLCYVLSEKSFRANYEYRPCACIKP